MNTPELGLRRLVTGLAVMAAAALLPPASGQTTYYVDGACGNNAWTGTSPVCTAPHGPKATIQAGIDAAIGGDEVIVADGVYTGAGNKGLDFEGRLITVRSANGPDACVIDCQGSGRAFELSSGETSDAVIQGFTITNGSADVGGGMILSPADATVNNCVFTNNTADVAGALRHDGLEELTLANCTFSGNTANYGAGALGSFGLGRLRVIGCVFANNVAQGAAAVATEHAEADFVDCFFARNIASWLAGGIADASDQTAMINCVLSRNEAVISGGTEFGSVGVELVNCTVAGNVGGGVGSDFQLTATNCIAWGNSPWQFDHWNSIVTYSDVEGGYAGIGNLDADPLFVQPGMDNLRLAIGSPCVNAGNNEAVPPDITTDIDGNPRIQDGTVDMGAYEGEFLPEAPAAGDDDLDNGDYVILIPTGGEPDPMEKAMVIVVNESGPDDQTFVVTEYEQDLFPDAGGYSELSCILATETSLEDGQYRAKLFIPFGDEGLEPVDPVEVNVTRYDPEVGAWALAVAGNTAASPGFDGPVGERILSLEGPPWNQSNELGDYGVCWDPALQKGFAWANVDREADFGVGVALCPADCRQTPNGQVDVVDFLALLARWGEASVGSPCDVDFDGLIGLEDFLALLDSWGVCPPEAVSAATGAAGGASFSGPAPALVRSPDLDGYSDLNTDGHVDVRDFLMLLANWQ